MRARNRALKIVVGVTSAGILLTLAVFFWMAFGIDRSGWTEENGIYSYLDSRGNPITGWMEEEGNRYYFDENDIMVTGWYPIEGVRYWFSPAGVQRTGWIREGDNRWYLPADSPRKNEQNSVLRMPLRLLRLLHRYDVHGLHLRKRLLIFHQFILKERRKRL